MPARGRTIRPMVIGMQSGFFLKFDETGQLQVARSPFLYQKCICRFTNWGTFIKLGQEPQSGRSAARVLPHIR